MGGTGLFMKRWYPKFNPYAQTLSLVLLWVRLPSLPPEFWNPKSLEAIDNAIGEFVCISDVTWANASTTFARLCIYVDLSKGLSDQSY